ncbi:MAG TPA: glycerophosphodiester phosphodiesterase [Polyangia bacterium]|nr:glycerophosphodiester phosphodiesterase [Polyangia bacterium]
MASGRGAWGLRPAGAGPLVVGHRGASARAPENSVEAFARARADGADGVELDVLQCASGEVVVFHDDDLARLGGRPERIDALPLAELRRVELRGGARIPTLEEAFEACGPDLLVNVELTAALLGGRRIAALVDGVAQVLARAGAAPRVLVSSFNPRAVRLSMRRLPAVPAALLFERAEVTPLRRAWAAKWLRPAALNPELVLCTPARVARWRALGYAVNVWTVDGAAAVRACRDMRVDGVITNDPGATRALLAS